MSETRTTTSRRAFSGFVSGHDFSRAVNVSTEEGFSPCPSTILLRKAN